MLIDICQVHHAHPRGKGKREVSEADCEESYALSPGAQKRL